MDNTNILGRDYINWYSEVGLLLLRENLSSSHMCIMRHKVIVIRMIDSQ